MDKWVSVDLPQNEVEKCPAGGRDVYLFPGRDIELDAEKNPTFGTTGESDTATDENNQDNDQCNVM